MSPEEIKNLEAKGARNILVETLIKTSDRLSEACGNYARVPLDGWGADSKRAEYSNEIKLYSNKINTLINHLESGT